MRRVLALVVGGLGLALVLAQAPTAHGQAQAQGKEDPPEGQQLYNKGRIAEAEGRFADAEAAFKQSIAVREAALGPVSIKVSQSVLMLGIVYKDQGRLPEAETAFKRALAIREKVFGPDHLDTVTAIHNLGALYRLMGRYGEAEPLLRRTLAIREKAAPPERVAETLLALGQLQRDLGRYPEAEASLKRALAIREATTPGDREVGYVLNNLAWVYRFQGRLPDAEAHFKRSLAVLQAALGPDHPEVGGVMGNLGGLMRIRGRAAEGEPLLKQALAITQKTLPPDHPAIGTALADLAETYRFEKKYADAEPLLKQALPILEKAYGGSNRFVGFALATMALNDDALKRPGAEAGYLRAITVLEAALGPDHMEVANARNNLARFYARTGHRDGALEQSRRTVAILARQLNAGGNQPSAGAISEQRRYRTYFTEAVRRMYGFAEVTPAQRDALTAEAFEVGQWALASSAGRAVAGMAARFAAGGDALAAVVRERQDLGERWLKLDDASVKAAAQDTESRDPARDAAQRAELARVTQAIEALDAKIARDFPSYAELSQPQPVKAAEVQKLLAADEAMIVFLVTEETTWVWVVRADRIALHKVDIKWQALAQEIRGLRQRLDPASNPSLEPYDTERAFALHRRLLAPAEPMLAGARHVMMVPDGSLQSLPIGVLVTEKPKDPTDYRSVAWLARRHAVTVLPSVSSLRALRLFAGRTAPATLPFVGIGDPALDGRAGTARGAVTLAMFRGGVADVDAVRKLAPLPDTANELAALARAQGAGADALFLRERATEGQLKKAPLDRYRIIAFATHGLVAGDLAELFEPALVLTPPRQGSNDDDGLLTASEIAKLKLNADWIVLSACNTAAGDGSPRADGLSGLAKAFFYAGSRALLVSHWPVVSSAAVRLTTGAFDALKAEPGIGRAEALRRSSVALLDDRSLAPEYAHPLVWAPFVVVGEGGANR
ncbi:MAG: CHAT domain-containing protein [Alphaproteobacteria bacterium]|nr:CHAT domain-containing protein [Alphaproteobacteria bacterium]